MDIKQLGSSALVETAHLVLTNIEQLGKRGFSATIIASRARNETERPA